MYNRRRYNFTFTMNTKQQQGIELIKEFLLENQRLLQNGQTELMRDCYIDFCKNFEKLVPVIVRSPIPKTFNQPVIIAVNHLHTPWIFQIKDVEFLALLGLKLVDFWYDAYLPTMVRHYPAVNLAKKLGLFPQVVSGQQPAILNEFVHQWHHVVVPPPEQPNKTQYLIEQIDQLTHPQYGLIIFPEGRDTGGHLYEYHYYMYPFRTGTAVIAHKLGLPILPVSLAFDTENLNYFMHVGDLIKVDTIQELSARDLTSRLQSTIIDGITQALPRVRVTLIEE